MTELKENRELLLAYSVEASTTTPAILVVHFSHLYFLCKGVKAKAK